MTMHINSLNRHLRALPPRRTPAPERSKVMANPVRTAINRQAARIIGPVRDWLSQPPTLPPEPKPSPLQKTIDQLRAELKTERNQHAGTRDALGNARLDLRAARAQAEQLQRELETAKAKLIEQADIIRQLEDLKL